MSTNSKSTRTGGRQGARHASGGRRRAGTRSRAPKRLVALFVMLLVCFSAMAARLVTLQIVDAPAYARLAVKQRQREVVFSARRGTVFDRNGEPLAISVDMSTIIADPSLIVDAPRTAAKLARILGADEEDLIDRLRGDSPGDRFEFVARHVEPKVARRVEQLSLPGIYMKREPKRYYPNERLASHVLGFVNVDGRGLGGVELQYEKILKGRPGGMSLEQDPAGRPLPQAHFSYRPPKPGRSLFLTIDKNIQYFVERALAEAVKRYRAKAGTAILMRSDSGEILALATSPDFDPNDPGKAPRRAFGNRALTQVYEPGSVFKIVTAAAALEERVVSPQTSFMVPDGIEIAGRVFHDSHSHATEAMTVRDIIVQSSNVGTIKIAGELGAEKLDEYVRRLGFGSHTGLDFPGESKGIVPSLENWSGMTRATLPLGQGIAVTPLQLISAYATVANGGVSVEPKLVSGTSGGGRSFEPSPSPSSRRVISARAARRTVGMLEGVVADGTGTAGAVPGYTVAGKTGTAQKPLPTGGYGDSHVASFAGFAPSRHPRVVALVVLDEPSPIWGGMTAAPTFSEIMRFALRRLGVMPRPGLTTSAVGAGTSGIAARD